MIFFLSAQLKLAASSPTFLLLSEEFLIISFGLPVPRTDSCLHQLSSPCHVRIAWYLYSDTSGLNPSLVTYNLVIWWHIIWAAFWAQLFLEKWESVAQFTESRIKGPVAHRNRLQQVCAEKHRKWVLNQNEAAFLCLLTCTKVAVLLEEAEVISAWNHCETFDKSLGLCGVYFPYWNMWIKQFSY